MSGFAKNRFCSSLHRPFSHSPGGTTQPWRTQDEYATLPFVVWWCVFVFAQLGVDNRQMKITSLPRPNEQRKIEKLLAKLAKIKSVSAKPAPTNSGKNLPQSA